MNASISVDYELELGPYRLTFEIIRHNQFSGCPWRGATISAGISKRGKNSITICSDVTVWICPPGYSHPRLGRLQKAKLDLRVVKNNRRVVDTFER